MQPSLSKRAQHTGEQPISFFMQQAVENPHLISLAAGLVDCDSLPGEDVQAALDDLFANSVRSRAILQYGTTQGYAPLREKILARTLALDHVSAAEVSLSPDDAVVTTGSQQLLYLLGEVLLDPGDIVITEAPSYFVYQGTLESLGARTLAVPMDEEGMITDALEEMLIRLERGGELSRVKMIYVCDYFQNPTGLTLSLPRRKHLMELVHRFKKKQHIYILEDAAYRELRYEGTDLPSLKSFDQDNAHVILAMTFSKPLAPGLKTGYGFLPNTLLTPVLRFKGNHDFGSCNLSQHLVDRLLENGAYDRHVEHLCEVYRGKRDALLQALADEFGSWNGNGTDQIHWTHPEGGLYVWLSLPPDLQTGPGSPMMEAALKEGVLYVPGQFCYVNGQNGPVPKHEARLSFGVAPLPQLRQAIQRLAHALDGLVAAPTR